MRYLALTALTGLMTFGPTLNAQQPRFGAALNLVLPVGEFSSRNYQFTSNNNPGVISTAESGYDTGLGAQFTISFPVDPKLAIRLNIGGQTNEGSDSAPGYETLNLRHSMFSLGGDLQIFTGSAYRHRGTYFLVGLSADFERFESSLGSLDYNYYYDTYNDVETTRKSRMGGNFGIGHTFGLDAGFRFNLEATFHKTLSGGDDPNPRVCNADFVRLGFGVVF